MKRHQKLIRTCIISRSRCLKFSSKYIEHDKGLLNTSSVGFMDFPIRKISTGHGQGVSRYVWRDSLLSDSP